MTKCLELLLELAINATDEQLAKLQTHSSVLIPESLKAFCKIWEGIVPVGENAEQWAMKFQAWVLYWMSYKEMGGQLK
ncbi:hypothetical protein ABFY48_06915 [Lysinibacillus pakistanensis]|uniref:hypothetical protein n=1 Tax=Lysinibacillus pakistanensis TaxID=759811 RepID=UPI003D273D09